MGIKLKWFRHRLTFDQLPTAPSAFDSSSSPIGRFRRSKSEAVIVTGYYRRSVDPEEVIDQERPKELPPIKARKKSQHSPNTTTLYAAPSLPILTEISAPVEHKRPDKVIAPKAPEKSKAPIAKLPEKAPPKVDTVETPPSIQQRPLPVPPPLPTSPPPVNDPQPWFEIDEELIDPEAIKAKENKRISPKKNAAPPPPPPPASTTRKSPPTDSLPVLASPAVKLTPFQYDSQSKENVHSNGSLNNTKNLPKVIKIGETTPPPVQKPSRLRALFGLSSPASSPEPPKPKTRRIRVPKEKSPKPMPRTIIGTESMHKETAINKTPSPKTKSPKEEKKNKKKTPSNPSSPKSIKLSPKPKMEPVESESYDTPLTIKPATSKANPPQAPIRKSKQTVPVDEPTTKPKQLSFAVNATVYSDDEVSMISSLNEDNSNDSWDLVAKHRASISQNADQFKTAASAKARQKPKSNGYEQRMDYVSIDKPKTMREMRKSQSVGAGVNLKNKELGIKEGTVESDTEA